MPVFIVWSDGAWHWEYLRPNESRYRTQFQCLKAARAVFGRRVHWVVVGAGKYA